MSLINNLEDGLSSPLLDSSLSQHMMDTCLATAAETERMSQFFKIPPWNDMVFGNFASS